MPAYTINTCRAIRRSRVGMSTQGYPPRRENSAHRTAPGGLGRRHLVARAAHQHRAEAFNEHASLPRRTEVTHDVRADLTAALQLRPAALQRLRKDSIRQLTQKQRKASRQWKRWPAGRESRGPRQAQRSHLKLQVGPCPLGKAPMMPGTNHRQLPGAAAVPAPCSGSGGRRSGSY